MPPSAAIACIPAIGAAKSETARIEIAQRQADPRDAGRCGIRRAVHHLERAGHRRDRRRRHREHAGDIPATLPNWQAGAVQPPRNVKVYEVRFYCAAGDAPARENRCPATCVTACVCDHRKSGPGIYPDPARWTTRISRVTPSLSTAASREAGSALGSLGIAGPAAVDAALTAPNRLNLSYTNNLHLHAAVAVAHRGRGQAHRSHQAEVVSQAAAGCALVASVPIAKISFINQPALLYIGRAGGV